MTGVTSQLRSWPLVAAGVLAAATGCGGSKGLVAVEGRVSFAGKQPPASGYLYFVPRAMSVNKRQDRSGSLPGTAIFLHDGKYQAGTFTPGDGLRPGTYEVRIECSTPDTRGKPSAADSHTASAPTLVPAGFVSPDLLVPPTLNRPLRFDIDVR